MAVAEASGVKTGDFSGSVGRHPDRRECPVCNPAAGRPNSGSWMRYLDAHRRSGGTGGLVSDRVAALGCCSRRSCLLGPAALALPGLVLLPRLCQES